MSDQLSTRVWSAIAARQDNGLIRRLRSPRPTSCDFSSNDYLGLNRLKEYKKFVSHYLQQYDPELLSSGSTGSRLLTGHRELTTELERKAADFHCMDEALLFNSGYDANLCILSSIPGRNDIIVYDELIHASMHDGMRMGRAKHRLHPFKHNDLTSLQDTIRECTSKHTPFASIIVCIETVYSMDGDIAPVEDILNICTSLQRELGCEVHVVADEAHGGGIYGEKGQGIMVQSNMTKHENLLAVVVTFGKAFGAHGAIILFQNPEIKTYLINYARPLIYSTALPPHSVCVLLATYAFMHTTHAYHARNQLMQIIRLFQRNTTERLPADMLLYDGHDDNFRFRYESPIQAIVVRGNEHCVRVANYLRRKGFDVYPIRSPTVPKGTERIRIVLHAHNTQGEIERLVTTILQSTQDLSPRHRL